MSFTPSEIMGGSSKFGDPFLLPSTEAWPSDIKTNLDLCLYLFRMNRLYGAICNRVVSYFITDLEFTEKADNKEKDSLKELLVNTLDVFAKMQQAGVEWAIYGNAFIRCAEPFERWLIDDRDGEYRAYSVSMFPQHLVIYHWETMEYEVPDLAAARKRPKGKRGAAQLPTVRLKFKDKPSAAAEKFSVVFLDPRYMELSKCHQADSVQYIYRIPPDMESRIKAGHLHEVNHTPRGMLAAVALNKDFQFRDGEIYHFRGPTPTGVSDSGWAVPEVLMHYDALYQLQIYRKADYAIAQNLLLPMRVFTPDIQPGVGDALMTMVMGRWRGEMEKMIAQHRKDPSSIHALGIPANYQEYGGNGKGMVMFDVVEAYTDALFDGLGFPRELYRGSLNPEQLPNSIRMFERHYEWLYQALDGMLRFVARTVQRAFDADEVGLRLKRPAMAYNAEWMQLRMQMAANREIPRGDVYPEIGIRDPVAASVAAIEEDQNIQREAEEMAANYEKERAQGSMADIAIALAEQHGQQQPEGEAPAGGAGGAPPAGGGLDYSIDTDSNPSVIQQRAEEIAVNWLRMHAEMPNSHRKEMQRAEAINPTLYAAASKAMENMRSQAASQGRAQVGQMLG
jgi:hypothetical protein